MMRKNIINYIINITLAALLNFSFVYALTASLNLKFNPASVMLPSFLFLILFSLVFFSRTSIIVSGIVSGVCLLTGIIFILYGNATFILFSQQGFYCLPSNGCMIYL